MPIYDIHAKVGPDGVPTLGHLPFADGQTVQMHVESAEPSPTPQRPFVLGLHQGQVWMSDDFDAPLPDSFWLGEDAHESASCTRPFHRMVSVELKPCGDHPVNNEFPQVASRYPPGMP